MAKSRFEYVRQFELPDTLLQGTFIVVRVDGRGFHKYVKHSELIADDRFSDTHRFEKPNDVRALELMDRAAMMVMSEYKDVVLAFGESDEYRYASH
jgi:tRNA(His) guanylyltransferase